MKFIYRLSTSVFSTSCFGETHHIRLFFLNDWLLHNDEARSIFYMEEENSFSLYQYYQSGVVGSDIYVFPRSEPHETHDIISPIIKFSPKNFGLLSRGKRQTVRLCGKTTPLGVNYITCGSVVAGTVDVLEVKHRTYGSLTEDIAIKDGFANLNDLKRELEHLYNRHIESSEIVAIITFSDPTFITNNEI